MTASLGLERCQSFINSQLAFNSRPRNGSDAQRRAVTISRQAGCGALAVAEKVAENLQAHTSKNDPRWTVFDRNLVEKVLEDHALPQRLTRFMPESWTSEIRDTIDDLCGLHPRAWLLVRQTAETILRLASLGNVILIGRASNIITAKLDHVVHVRLVASLERRTQQIQHRDHLDRKAALEFIQEADKGRQRYLRKHYQRDINDPLLYHLVINTELVGYEEAARIISDYVLARNPHEQLVPAKQV